MTQEGKEGDKDVYGIEMKFILSCKDHFTQFVMLAAIPSKSTKIIAHHLGIMYGIMGFPTIYQTDNGNEVCGNEVVRLVMENNPHIDTITGRPRTPREQGSVENANNGIRNTVQSIVSEEWACGNTEFNWTMALGRAMGTLNGAFRRTTANAISSYETVFGTKFYSPNSEAVKGLSSTELRIAGTTAVERCLRTRSSALTEKYAICGEITEANIEDLGDLASPRVQYLMHNYKQTHKEAADDKFMLIQNSNWSLVPEGLRPISVPDEHDMVREGEETVGDLDSKPKAVDLARKQKHTATANQDSEVPDDDLDCKPKAVDNQTFRKEIKSRKTQELVSSSDLAGLLYCQPVLATQKAAQQEISKEDTKNSSNVDNKPDDTKKSSNVDNKPDASFDASDGKQNVLKQGVDISKQKGDLSKLRSDKKPDESFDASDGKQNVLKQGVDISKHKVDLSKLRSDKKPDESFDASDGKQNVLKQVVDISKHDTTILEQNPDLSKQDHNMSKEENDSRSKHQILRNNDQEDSGSESVIVVAAPKGTPVTSKRNDNNPLLSTVLNVLVNSDGFRNAQAADKTLQVFMKCEICPDLFVNKDVLFNIPSGECLEHYFGENSRQWLPHSLVHTFGQLASHWNHSSTVIFYACMHNLSMATFLEISKIIGEISPVLKDNANIDEIVSLGFTGDHYAVIHILLSEKRAIVYDGMVTSTMDVWKNVVKYVLWKFGVQGLDNMDELIDERTKQKTEGIIDQWTISRDQTISGVQLDTHSCGPIAMLVIACLFQTRQSKMDDGTSLSQLHPANVPSKNWRSTACTLFKKFIEFTWTNMYSVKTIRICVNATKVFA